MSDDATPRLSLPYLAAAQAQKHVTLNEGLARLDGLVQTAAQSRTTDAQPGSPADGELYIMTAAASGADWGGQPEGALMRFEAGAWTVLEVAGGHVAYVKDDAVLVVFDGTDWAELAGSIGELQNLPLLGVNATADATNKLAVSSSAVLFNHVGAGVQAKLNKNSAGDTASHLLQTGFSGRAEFGLIGSDDLSLKVSGDGSAWHDVLDVERITGKATFALSALRPTEVTVFTSSGTYAVPDWARRLRIICIGGGGGGSGAAGDNTAIRGGGGGGGAGGRSELETDVDELDPSLTVTIGAGGAAVTGAAAGLAGSAGGQTLISLAGGVILLAGSGGAGAGGGASTAAGGTGGTGNVMSNAGGSGAAASAATVGASSTRAEGPGGGGGGGGGSVLTTGSTVVSQRGGNGYSIGGALRQAVFGAANGGTGADKAWECGCGGGGGGGDANASGNGTAGGAGGGGGTRNAYNSGAGGAGGRGEVWIVAIG